MLGLWLYLRVQGSMCFPRSSHGHRLAVSLARLDFLAGLLDLLKDGIVGERLFGDNLGGLVLERNIE